jgi:hypothetical protein
MIQMNLMEMIFFTRTGWLFLHQNTLFLIIESVDASSVCTGEAETSNLAWSSRRDSTGIYGEAGFRTIRSTIERSRPDLDSHGQYLGTTLLREPLEILDTRSYYWASGYHGDERNRQDARIWRIV